MYSIPFIKDRIFSAVAHGMLVSECSIVLYEPSLKIFTQACNLILVFITQNIISFVA
jgi:hypothetical protein